MIICPECQCEQESLHFEKCPRCHIEKKSLDEIAILLSNRDLESPLFSDYKNNYDKISEDDLDHSLQSDAYLEIQTEKLFSYLPKLEGQSVLEIGVGQGRLTKMIANANPRNCVGVDIAPAYLKKLSREKVPFTPCISNAENLPFKDEFDTVVSADVLEHVLNVGNYLYSVNQSLKKGGTFVVRVPYLEDYTTYSRFKGCPYDFVHLRNFSKKSLQVILEGAGFEVERFHFDGFVFSSFRFCDKKWNIPFRLMRKALKLYLEKVKKDQTLNQTAALPNWLGNLLIQPKEITAVCRKK